MQRFVAALVLAGTMSMSVMVPGASAQGFGGFGGFPGGFGPQMESFGFSGNTPFYSSSFSGPGGIQCQYGGYLGGSGNSGSSQSNITGFSNLGSISRNNVTPFFTASAYGPVFGPGPCTPPSFATPFFGQGGGFGGNQLGSGGLGSLSVSTGTVVSTTANGLNCRSVSSNVAICR